VVLQFDMPTEGSDSTSKVLYAVHEEGDMDLGLAAETVDCSVLRRTDALKLLANILAGKNEGPGTGAQLRLDQYVLEKHITNWFALHDTDKVATLNVSRLFLFSLWLCSHFRPGHSNFPDDESLCDLEGTSTSDPRVLRREGGDVLRVSG
jgi:hypothetical protein